MLHYVILLVGFFVALGALGIDLTKVTILAGAFTVGIGFGLQNVINNFVSGVILLFERPIKVGAALERSNAVLLQDGPCASCDRNFLVGQGIIHNHRKITSQLSPVLIAIRPSSKLKGYRTGAEIDYVDLRNGSFATPG